MFELKRDQQYAQIASEEESVRTKRCFPHNRSIGCVSISVILAFCLTTGLVILVYQVQKPRMEYKQPMECGSSLDEFEANGCVFDLLSYNWIPPRCKDDTTLGEFRSWLSEPRRNMGPWPFFTSSAGIISPSEDRISNEVDFGNRWDMEIWSSMEEHIAHCMFLFLHVSRVAVGEAPLRTSDTVPHAQHCFDAIWKGLNGTWNLNDDLKADQRIGIETASC